ncbi:AraC family transcriptional regulator [Paenibacillus oceani]|uniref:Helix-turn-helix transcriptional regulator n=1 Tax=Paenibacillus oceani TaxID=2772510 RepID=A0A927CFN4_9BACL|nr:AraC family transcriptional regulator [Paenibacillus oceani]MBD2865106.1 helix-turn-helix transcriptional regulator [Paenibacillus oceani]
MNALKGTNGVRASSHYFSIKSDKRSEHFDMSTLHFHANFEIYYLLSGERNYFIQNRLYRISKGDLVFINPYDVHKTMVARVPEHERIVMYFQKELIGPHHRLLKDGCSPFCTGNPILSLDVHEQRIAEELFYKIMAEHKNRGKEYEVCIGALVLEFLIFALRCNEKRLNRPAEDVSPNHKKVLDIVRHIHDRFHERLSLDVLSKRFYMSPTYLSRVFKATIGFSLVEFITIVRIKEAQRLLRETDCKVIEISEDVGFDNFSHFGKSFKKITNCSPLQYRKRTRM